MRNNPHKKTGPNTPEGKARSSQNSTTHGLRSEHFRLLKGESPEEFEKVHQGWLAQYDCQSAQPVSGVVRDSKQSAQHGVVRDSKHSGILLLIEKLAQDDWIIRRAMRALCDAQENLIEAQAAGESEEVIDKLERRLMLNLRYKTTAENSFKRTLQQIEALLARETKEQQKERVVFMRENLLAHKILIQQRKAGMPNFLPWSPKLCYRNSDDSQTRH